MRKYEVKIFDMHSTDRYMSISREMRNEDSLIGRGIAFHDDELGVIMGVIGCIDGGIFNRDTEVYSNPIVAIRSPYGLRLAELGQCIVIAPTAATDKV